MAHFFTSVFLRWIALYAFLLNAAWEFIQCSLFYGMWDWPFRRATVWMWAAIIGDVMIVIGIVSAASLIVGARHLRPLDRKGWLVLLIIGFLASIMLEWLARWLNLWSYNPRMPTLPIFGESVGLLPILQVTILPAVCVYLATRSIYKRSGSLRHPFNTAGQAERAGKKDRTPSNPWSSQQ